jgi:non-heme chloroperoxidase
LPAHAGEEPTGSGCIEKFAGLRGAADVVPSTILAPGCGINALYDGGARRVFAQLAGCGAAGGAGIWRQRLPSICDAMSAAGPVIGRREGRHHIRAFEARRLDEARRYLDAISTRRDQAITRLHAYVSEDGWRRFGVTGGRAAVYRGTRVARTSPRCGTYPRSAARPYPNGRWRYAVVDDCGDGVYASFADRRSVQSAIPGRRWFGSMVPGPPVHDCDILPFDHVGPVAGRIAVPRRAAPTIPPGTVDVLQLTSKGYAMSTITTKDGTEIYYKDWGTGQPIVFHHGWPLSADDWDAQMLFFLHKGYRVIAHDRRGHGRSSQTATGNEMDTYAADVAELAAALDLRDAVHIGHSTGGGEVARYVARHGKGRVAKAVLIGAVPPIMVQNEKNPGGLPREVFDGFRDALAANRAQFFLDVPAGPFYGYNRSGAKVSQGVIRNWWRQGMMGGAKAHYDCIEAFSETDFTEDLKQIDVPVLILHGDDDQIVPIADSALLTAKLVKNGTLKVYKGLPHGMCTTHAEIINPDLLAFIQS